MLTLQIGLGGGGAGPVPDVMQTRPSPASGGLLEVLSRFNGAWGWRTPSPRRLCASLWFLQRYPILPVVRTLSSCVATLSVQRESNFPFAPPGALLSDATFQGLHEANPAVIDT